MNADLTVVIPNYNNARYLKKAINSILAQSLKSDIIVVDDCSTDNSRLLLQEMADKVENLTIVFLEENGGVSNARNVGLERCKTEYITFMDADDFYYNEDKLKLEMEIVDRYRKINKDVVAYSVTANVDENGVLIQNRYNTHWRKKQFITGNKAKYSLIIQSKQGRIPRDYIIRTQLLRKIGGYSYPKNFYEDLDLLMRLGMENIPFDCTFQYGTGYRRTTSGLSGRPLDEHIAERNAIAKCYYDQLSHKEQVLCRILKKNVWIWNYLKSKVLLPIRNRFERKSD